MSENDGQLLFFDILVHACAMLNLTPDTADDASLKPITDHSSLEARVQSEPETVGWLQINTLVLLGSLPAYLWTRTSK